MGKITIQTHFSERLLTSTLLYEVVELMTDFGWQLDDHKRRQEVLLLCHDADPNLPFEQRFALSDLCDNYLRNKCLIVDFHKPSGDFEGEENEYLSIVVRTEENGSLCRMMLETSICRLLEYQWFEYNLVMDLQGLARAVHKLFHAIKTEGWVKYDHSDPWFWLHESNESLLCATDLKLAD